MPTAPIIARIYARLGVDHRLALTPQPCHRHFFLSAQQIGTYFNSPNWPNPRLNHHTTQSTHDPLLPSQINSNIDHWFLEQHGHTAHLQLHCPQLIQNATPVHSYHSNPSTLRERSKVEGNTGEAKSKTLATWCNRRKRTSNNSDAENLAQVPNPNTHLSQAVLSGGGVKTIVWKGF